MMASAQKTDLIQRLLELSWKPKKIFLQTAALIVAYFIFLFFRAIAPEAPWAAIWARVIMFIGWVIIYLLLLFVLTAIAKITVAEVTDEEEIGAAGALKAAGGSLKSIFTSPLKIFAVIAGLWICHVVIDLWGKVPFFGELGWMFSPIFTFPLGIAAVATILILLFGGMILPVIIAIGKEGPVSELIDFLRKNTIKFAGHFITALIVAVVTLIILTSALSWSRGVSISVMREKYSYVQKHIPGFVQHVPGMQAFMLMRQVTTPDEYSQMAFTEPKADRWTLKVAGFVFGIAMWLIHVSIWGYVMVDFGVAGSLSYLGLAGTEAEKTPAPRSDNTEPEAIKPAAGRKSRKKAEESEFDAASPPGEGEEKFE